jgi:ketosteroid isomerase-like protein
MQQDLARSIDGDGVADATILTVAHSTAMHRTSRMPIFIRRWIISSVISVAAFSLLGCSTSAIRNSATVADEIAQLTRQADAWDKAIVRKNRAAIVANMADDFRQIGGSGNVANRDEFVAAIVADDLEIDPYTVEEFDVRVYGDVALLSGRTHMTGRYNGKGFTSHYRYVDVYVRKDAAWKVANVQITELPE